WVVAAPARAAIVLADPADAGLRHDGTISNGLLTGRVGASTTSPGEGGRAVVYVFQLPTPPLGLSPVTDASLSFVVSLDRQHPAYNIDLYALPARSDPAVQSTDAFFGPLDPAATLIEDNILPADTVQPPVSLITTDPAANTSLVTWLNSQYGVDGSGAGKYVFLRLNPDIDPPVENSGVDVVMAENAANVAAMTINFVPEPATAIAGACLLGLSTSFRRSRGRFRWR
ncbi:MAG TPA: hypothetical protein VH475_03010, partial [Tepidisphaeraceae bacterium]